MPKYFTLQDHARGRLAIALQSYKISATQALALLTQVATLRLENSPHYSQAALAPTTLTQAERCAVVLHLLQSSRWGMGSAAKVVNHLIPVMGMGEFVALLETHPAKLSGGEIDVLATSLLDSSP